MTLSESQKCSIQTNPFVLTPSMSRAGVKAIICTVVVQACFVGRFVNTRMVQLVDFYQWSTTCCVCFECVGWVV